MKRKIIISLLVSALLVQSLLLSSCKPKNDVPNNKISDDVLDSSVENLNVSKALSEEMANGNFSNVVSKFSETLKSSLDEKTLKDVFNSTVEPLGKYLGITHEITSETSGDFIVFNVILDYETNGIIVKLTFNKNNEIDGLYLNYHSHEHEAAENEKITETSLELGEHKLKGILTTPAGVENAPCVILVQGSGPNDMDETIGAAQNKPFRDIAVSLAENGIASIRYNKRYNEHPELAKNPTIQDEVLDDVCVAIQYSQICNHVDKDKIYVLGHSLGGMLAPKIALDNKEVKGIIILAGSPRYLNDIVYDQNMNVLNADTTMSQKDKDAYIKQITDVLATVKTAKENGTKNILGVTEGYWYSLNQINTPDILKKINIPMLILQGSADFQVFPDKDYKEFNDLLKDRTNVTFKLFENLNHLFMKSNGKNDITEYNTKASVESDVTAEIINWIKSEPQLIELKTPSTTTDNTPTSTEKPLDDKSNGLTVVEGEDGADTELPSIDFSDLGEDFFG